MRACVCVCVCVCVRPELCAASHLELLPMMASRTNFAESMSVPKDKDWSTSETRSSLSTAHVGMLLAIFTCQQRKGRKGREARKEANQSS